jgi:hypothetical protein
MRELIISRSSEALNRWLKIRTPSEQTFSVVVRSVAPGSLRLEICTGTSSRIRFSIRPDRAGICEMTFQAGIS